MLAKYLKARVSLGHWITVVIQHRATCSHRCQLSILQYSEHRLKYRIFKVERRTESQTWRDTLLAEFDINFDHWTDPDWKDPRNSSDSEIVILNKRNSTSRSATHSIIERWLSGSGALGWCTANMIEHGSIWILAWARRPVMNRCLVGLVDVNFFHL